MEPEIDLGDRETRIIDAYATSLRAVLDVSEEIRKGSMTLEQADEALRNIVKDAIGVIRETYGTGDTSEAKQ